MKRKVYSILTVMVLFMSVSITAFAADATHSSAEISEDIGVETSLAESVTKNYYGTSYNVVLLNMTCECVWNRNSSNTTDIVHAGTADGSAIVVTINSTAYNSSNKSLGGSGNAGNGSTYTSYTASETVYYSYQKHSAPEISKIAEVMLFRY